jgi:hypothetical protein
MIDIQSFIWVLVQTNIRRVQGALMRTTIVLILVAAAAPAYGKLPPQSDAAKAQAGQTAAKAAWDDKVSAASEAHSPAGTATSPPSTNIPAAEMPKATK